MSYDLIALGETMIALAPPPGTSLRQADAWRADHAGAESNTCVGLARLGLTVAWVSRLGADAPGDRIVDALDAERVDTRWVRRDPRRPTGLMVKDPATGVRYYRTGSAASALGPDDLEGVPIAEARAVLVSGVTALIGEPPQAAGLALLHRARGLRIVDPNLRDGLWGSARRRELVLPLVDASDLLFAGSAELAELVLGPHDDLRRLAELAHARGPAEVVVRGPHAIGVRDRDGAWRTLDIRRDAAIDPIGAGDAFNAGYIAVRLNGGSIEDALAAGARCGAAVTTAMSDTAAFPRSL
jgi:2-dehydro-3-deoxygluconokinase